MSARNHVLGALIASFVAFILASFFLRLSPSSVFQQSWHQLKREGDHLLMNVVHVETRRAFGIEAEVLWQGGEASGESMGCVVNFFRTNQENRQLVVALAGICPQEFAYHGYMIDGKMGELFWLGIVGGILFVFVVYLALRWYVYRETATAWLGTVSLSMLFGVNVAHLFPWPVIFSLPVQIRMFIPG